MVIMSKKQKKNNKFVMPDITEEIIDGVTIEKFGNEHIYLANVSREAEEYQKLYGANKNLYRVIPSFEDGLKPVTRRLLWSWWITSGKPESVDSATFKNMKLYKVSKLASDTMTYHPHSDDSAEDIIGKFGQPWKNNVKMIETKGSFGNQESSGPAAGRYINAKLGEFIIDCFFKNFSDYCIPMKESYSGHDMECEYLPANQPFVLYNPQFSGIGLTQPS